MASVTTQPSAHTCRSDRGEACLPCRKKKMRCDSMRPTCSSCLRSFSPNDCTYAGKRLSKTTTLTNRIKDLENQIQELELISRAKKKTKSQNTDELVYLKATGGAWHCSISERPQPYTPRPPHSSKPEDILACKIRLAASLTERPMLETRRILIGQFLFHCRSHGFELHIPRFLHRLSLPPIHTDSPHPCLVSAIMLFGCHFVQSAYKSYEPCLLTKLRKEMSDALAMVDRLFDFMVASSLLARWYAIKLRALEALHEATTISQFAIACHLNLLSSPLPSEAPQSILPEPRDEIELGERINTWWVIFMTDKMISMYCDTSSTIADTKITTIWPRTFDDYIKRGAYSAENAGITAMFREDGTAFSVAEDCNLSLRLKSVVLLDRACQLATGRVSGTWPMLSQDSKFFESFWKEINALEAHATTFLHSLPPVHDTRGMSEHDLGDFAVIHACLPSRSTSLNPWIVGALTLTHGTLMEIHHISVPYDPVAYTKMVRDAENIARIIKETEGVEVCRMIASSGFGWVAACDVLLQDAQRMIATSDTSQSLDGTKEMIRSTLSGIESLLDVAPAYKPSCKRLRTFAASLNL